MRALTLGLALLFGSTALAASELQLKSNMPVVLIVDGETQGTVQPLEPLLIDIEPGVRNLRIQGMLGRSLYDRDLIFDDQTRTELVWQRKELRLGGVVKLDPVRPGEDEDVRVADAEVPPSAPADPAEVEDPPAVDEDLEPVVAAAPPPRASGPQEPERPPLTRPSAPPPPTPVAANPFGNADPYAGQRRAPEPEVAVAPERAPVGPSSASGGGVLIEATPGMDLKITHGAQMLRVTVQDGELVVIDANGTEIRFPGNGEAF